MIEAWSPASAEAETLHALPGFRRTPSDEAGRFRFNLTRPAAQNAGEPAMLVTVFARGLVSHQFSAVFLDDDGGLAHSHILQQVPSERRPTLVARKIGPAATSGISTCTASTRPFFSTMCKPSGTKGFLA